MAVIDGTYNKRNRVAVAKIARSFSLGTQGQHEKEVGVFSPGAMQVSTNISGADPELYDAYNDVSIMPSVALYSKIQEDINLGNDGSYTGLTRVRASEGHRLAVGQDVVLFSADFSAAAQNTQIWEYKNATLTFGPGGTFPAQFSAVQGTTSAHGAYLRSWNYFPMRDTDANITASFRIRPIIADMVANEEFLCGFGLPSAANTSPTDGVFFRCNSTGIVTEFWSNGVQNITGSAFLYGTSGLRVNIGITLGIEYSKNIIRWWASDQSFEIADGYIYPDSLTINQSLPIFMQKRNIGNVSNTNRIQVFDVAVVSSEKNSGRGWQDLRASLGANSAHGQDGQTMGSAAANLTNASAIPAGAAGSNTVTNITGLGGIGTFNAEITNVATSGTRIFCTFTNPVSSLVSSVTGRNLFITGVNISSISTGAVSSAVTLTTLLWELAYGHTAVSMATADTASYATGTTHSPRYVPLGFQSLPLSSAIGTPFNRDVGMTFDVPICIRPGENVALIHRFIVGAATASQTIVTSAEFTGYWE